MREGCEERYSFCSISGGRHLITRRSASVFVAHVMGRRQRTKWCSVLSARAELVSPKILMLYDGTSSGIALSNTQTDWPS